MPDTDTGLRGAARGAADSIATASLGVAGGVLAWFAYIDAPITDGAMALVAIGVPCAVLAAAAAMLARELLLTPAAGDGPAPLLRSTRLRRVALGLLLLALLLLAAATLATLNLRGSGDAAAEDARTTALHEACCLRLARLDAPGTAGKGQSAKW